MLPPEQLGGRGILHDQAITPWLNFTVTLTPGTGSLGNQINTVVTIHNTDGTPTQRYVTATFEVLLLRSVDPAGLAYWGNRLDNGEARGVIAAALTHSGEYFAVNVIKPAYLKFLNRPADSNGVNYWTGNLQAGLTDEQMQAGFIASPEFYDKANGGSGISITEAHDRAWIDALYEALLGRVPDMDGEEFWAGQLNGGVSRISVAEDFTGSQEGLGDRVLETYQRYLDRNAGTDEIAFWVAQYHQGAANEDIVTGFIGSNEFYAQATK
jgi:hypothetical protein